MPADHRDEFSLFNRLYAFNSSTIFMNQPRMLEYWSHSIEKKIIQHGVDTPVYAGFQRLDYFGPVASTYKRIAQSAPVWVLGQSDGLKTISQDQNMMRFIPLSPYARLAREWFVVVNHPRYAHALIAREVSPLQPRPPYKERQFQGILTSDRNIIHFACQSLEAYVEQYTVL